MDSIPLLYNLFNLLVKQIRITYKVLLFHQQHQALIDKLKFLSYSQNSRHFSFISNILLLPRASEPIQEVRNRQKIVSGAKLKQKILASSEKVEKVQSKNQVIFNVQDDFQPCSSPFSMVPMLLRDEELIKIGIQLYLNQSDSFEQSQYDKLLLFNVSAFYQNIFEQSKTTLKKKKKCQLEIFDLNKKFQFQIISVNQIFFLNSIIMALKFFLLLTFFHNSLSQTCLADPGCEICNFYYFMINFTPYGYFQCDQCYSNYFLNQTIGICQCKKGYYQDSVSEQCLQCNTLCLSCIDKTLCNQCSPSYNRILVNGNCLCVDGYEQKNNQLSCVKKVSALIVALPSVGSVIFCILMSFIFYKIYKERKNNGDIQIHDVSASNNVQRVDQYIDIYMENNQAQIQNQNPNLLWACKRYEFKAGQLCSICLDQSPMYMTLCGHYFHFNCIFSWIQNHGNCPNCNQGVDVKNIRVWCLKCKNCLMPVVKQISFSKKSARGKKQIKSSSPMQCQTCNNCESTEKAIGKQMFN